MGVQSIVRLASEFVMVASEGKRPGSKLLKILHFLPKIVNKQCVFHVDAFKFILFVLVCLGLPVQGQH